MKKIVVYLAVTFLFGSVSMVLAEFKSEYNNQVGYENGNKYSNTEHYDNKSGYNNLIDYTTEFIKGKARQQMVQKTDSSGKTVQAVLPVGLPDEKIGKDMKGK